MTKSIRSLSVLVSEKLADRFLSHLQPTAQPNWKVAAPHKSKTPEITNDFKGLNGAPEETRTPNLLIRSQMLYPIELRAHDNIL